MAISRRRSWPPLFSLDGVVLELKRLPSLQLVVYLSRQALRVHQGLERSLLDDILLWTLVALWAWAVLAYTLDRYAWATQRHFEWDEEVVLVTGGSSGLGRIIADTFAMRGVSVAVLDPRPYEGSHDNVNWYNVDIGNEENVLKARETIEADVSRSVLLVCPCNSSSMLLLPSLTLYSWGL